MKEAHLSEGRWPIAWLFVLTLVSFFAWMRFQPSFVTSQSAFTEPICLGTFGLVVARFIFAAVRKERGRGWIFYAALVVVVPIAAELYARAAIPFVLDRRSAPRANQALQPTRMLVTFCAYAQPAPSTRVADL